MFQPDFNKTESRQPASWQHYLVAQDWHHFSPEEHGVWDTLFARQVPYLGSRIVTPFLEGIPSKRPYSRVRSLAQPTEKRP